MTFVLYLGYNVRSSKCLHYNGHWLHRMLHKRLPEWYVNHTSSHPQHVCNTEYHCTKVRQVYSQLHEYSVKYAFNHDTLSTPPLTLYAQRFFNNAWFIQDINMLLLLALLHKQAFCPDLTPRRCFMVYEIALFVPRYVRLFVCSWHFGMCGR